MGLPVGKELLADRARLLEKMGLKSTAELIRYGLEHGLAE